MQVLICPVITIKIIITIIEIMITGVLRRAEGTEEQGVSDPEHLSLLAS